MTLDQFVQTLSTSFTSQLERLVAYIPDIALAAVLVLLGWVIGRIVGVIVKRLSAETLGRLSFGERFAQAAAEGKLLGRIPALLGIAAYWIVFILFLGAALEQLRIPALSGLLTQLAQYSPRLLVGILIGFLGLILGGAVDSWVTTTLGAAGSAHSVAVGRAARYGVVLVALVMAADQAGIESTFLIIAAGVLLAVVTSGVAAAFALGSAPAVSNLIAAHYAGQRAAPGMFVRVGAVEGTIHELTPTSVVLRHEGHEILVPARKFLDEVVIIEQRAEA